MQNTGAIYGIKRIKQPPFGGLFFCIGLELKDKSEKQEDIMPTALFIHEPHQSRLLIRMLLQYCGFDVVSVSGDEIFKSIKQIPMDFIVFDFIYDNKYLEYSKRLRQENETKDIPLVAIIANAKFTQEEIDNALIDKVIHAPVDLTELELFFRKWFEKLSK